MHLYKDILCSLLNFWEVLTIIADRLCPMVWFCTWPEEKQRKRRRRPCSDRGKAYPVIQDGSS